jgi:hypothetical protein
MERLGMEREDVSGGAATKPLAASVNGKQILNPNWAAILIKMIAQVKARGVKGKALALELAVPAKPAKYEEEGFRYYPELGISVQGQSAADSWKEAARLAGKWRIPVSVEFQWRQNPKAQHPGRRGVLQAGH